MTDGPGVVRRSQLCVFASGTFPFLPWGDNFAPGLIFREAHLEAFFAMRVLECFNNSVPTPARYDFPRDTKT